MSKFQQWRMARARFLFQLGGAPYYPWYIRITPSFGFGVPWFRRGDGKKQRIRAAKHHGLQITTWYGARWVVTRQVFGRSTVIGESMTERAKQRQ